MEIPTCHLPKMLLRGENFLTKTTPHDMNPFFFLFVATMSDMKPTVGTYKKFQTVIVKHQAEYQKKKNLHLPWPRGPVVTSMPPWTMWFSGWPGVLQFLFREFLLELFYFGFLYLFYLLSS